MSSHRVDREAADSPAARDDGSAIIEFVFVALLVLVPLVYLVVAVAEVQRSRLAVTNAARDVGRAIETSRPGSDPDATAQAALGVAIRAQHLDPAEVEVRYVSTGASCTEPAIVPQLAAGSQFTVCVTRHQQLPALPTVLERTGITTVGRYLAHLDDFRSYG